MRELTGKQRVTIKFLDNIAEIMGETAKYRKKLRYWLNKRYTSHSAKAERKLKGMGVSFER